MFLLHNKNKAIKEGLEKALELCLITKKEFLELKMKRAENDFKNYSEVKVKVKRK